jgi:iron complex transport system substrate-binding protein
MQKASASEVTTTSEDDYVLGVYGNANEDDTIDMGDVVYTKLAIFDKKPKTELCDAKYDGRINVLDVIQTKLIILGKEKELTFIEGTYQSVPEAVTVSKPVERIVVEYMDTAELVRILNEKDKIVGVTSCIRDNKNQFPDLSKLPWVGKTYSGTPDYEAVLSLNPDVYLEFGKRSYYKEKLPGVACIYLGLKSTDLSNPEGSGYTAGVRKLGYILDREDEAEEYVKWRIGWINEMKSRTEGLSEDERPRICMGSGLKTGSSDMKVYAKHDSFAQMGLLAGGKNIAEDLPEFVQPAYGVMVDLEWLIEQNPEFIFVHEASTPYGYDMDDPETRLKGKRDMYMNSPVLANVAAVKTGNVYIMNGIFRNDVTGGVTGAVYIAKLLYPNLFEDLDPEAVHQEYLDLQHFDYDLDEHGIFVYPPIITGEGKLAGIPDRYYDSIIAQP